MILLYTGEGKGKSSACIGQALRSLGSGLSVAFGQFLKKTGCAGEQSLLASLLGDNFMAGGSDFFVNEAQREDQLARAAQLLDWAATRQAQMLVLDEALYALSLKLIEPEQLLPFIEGRRSQEWHLTLSGRVAPAWLAAMADIHTEMREIRHYYQRKQPAIRGIEY